MHAIPRSIALAVAVGVLASGCTTPAPSPAPVVTATDTSNGLLASLQSAGPVPASAATGPSVPTVWPKSWLNGPGLSVSTTPTLAAPIPGERFSYEIYDVSAGEQPGVGRPVADTTTRGPWTVPAGRLSDGRQYTWRVRSAESADTKWTAAFPFTVDTVRSGMAPRDQIGGVSTHLITGVPTVTWMSRAFPTVSGRAVATLDFTAGRTAVAGLPAGWRWTPPLVSRWTTFIPSKGQIDGAPLSVYISDADQHSMTFTRNSSGAYAQSWSNGRPVTSAQSAVLRQIDGAWQLFEVNGDLTVFKDNWPVATANGGIVRGTATWSGDGTLTQVEDPSGRRITLRYGPDCPTAPGFVAPPDGYLCGMNWWDGTRTDMYFVSAASGVQIGLIVDAAADDESASGNGLGFGWDAAGRLAALRTPLVTAAAANDQSLRDRLDVLTQIEYDSQGRVAAVAESAPAPDADRLLHSYTYPTITTEDVSIGGSATAAVTAQRLRGTIADGRRTPIASTLKSNRTYEMVVDAASWRPLRRVDRDGAMTQMQWDSKGQRVVGTVDYEGRVTSYTYDPEGRRSGFTGPSSSSGGAYKQNSTYDEVSSGTPMKGLSARYWASDALLTAATSGGWIGRNGAVSQNWPESPVGAPWSAQFTGTWNTGATEATWVIEAVASSGANLRMYLDNEECVLDSQDRCRLKLPAGDHSLRIDFTAPGAAALRVTAGKEEGGRAPDNLADLERIYPDFNVTSSTTTNDATSGNGPFLATRTSYLEPWTGNPTRVTGAGGLASEATYESAGLGQWGRKTSGVTPGRRVTAMDYWPVQGEPVSSPCPGADAAQQAGALRTITRSDGVVIQRWHDAAGRVSALLTAPTAGDTARGELACWKYGADGTLLASALYGPGGVAVEKSTVEARVGGDPRITRTSITTDAGAGIFPKATSTQMVTDLLGRAVSWTDATGVVFTYTYDIHGRQLTRTATLADRTLVTSAEEYDSLTGRPTRMLIDGKEIARISYDRTGRVSAVRYATGVTQAYTYRPNGSVEVSQVRLADGTLVEDSTRSNVAGRISTRVSEVRGPSGTLLLQRRWTYGFDQAARLVEANLALRGSSVATSRRTQEFKYGFDAPDNSCAERGLNPGADLDRTSGMRNGVAYVVCYDKAGRPVSTTDPLLAPDAQPAVLDWDALGRFTRSTGLTVTWRWGGLPQQIRDATGPATVESEFAHVLGRVVAQRSSDGSAETTTRMAYANPSATAPSVIMDGTGAPVQVRLLLPGGGLWKRMVQGEVTIDHPGIRGELLVTTAADGTAVASASGEPLAEATGPFGEPLGGGGGPRQDAPVYGFGFADLESTVPGGAGIVLKVARPYLPALGMFLAFDPEPGASSTGYGFAEADPVNFSDPDGAYSWWDFARSVLAVASLTASLMIPGAQWYTVLAISTLTSSASLGITALERDANGQSLTAADWVLEGVSVAIDMAVVGGGAAKSAWSARRTATSVTEESLEELTESSLKTASKPANTTTPPTLTGSITQASLLVAGIEVLTRSTAPSAPVNAGGEQGSVEPEDCPSAGGCDQIPARAVADRGPDRL